MSARDLLLQVKALTPAEQQRFMDGMMDFDFLTPIPSAQMQVPDLDGRANRWIGPLAGRWGISGMTPYADTNYFTRLYLELAGADKARTWAKDAALQGAPPAYNLAHGAGDDQRFPALCFRHPDGRKAADKL